MQTYQRHTNKAGRWDFYRTRAEGHNTLVINPKFRGNQKRTEDGIAKFTKFESGKESAQRYWTFQNPIMMRYYLNELLP